MTLVMLANGDDPAKVTDKSWNAAFNRIKKASDSGQIRSFTGNDYGPPLAKGDLSAAMSWSGDIPQTRQPAHPLERAEGRRGDLDRQHADPQGRRRLHRLRLHELRYDPKVQGLMEAGDPKQNITGIYYIPPVAGAGEWAKKFNPPVGNNPLIFPTTETLDQMHIFDNAALNNEKYLNQWNNLISG